LPENESLADAVVEDEIAAPSVEHMPDEAIRLLVDALKALESKMFSTTFPAGDVLQMMCRLRPDFDLETFGFRSFQALCERATSDQLVEMEYVDGIWHNLKSIKEKMLVCSTDVKDTHSSERPNVESLRNWLEGKLTGNRRNRVCLPPFEERIALYKKMCLVLRDCDDGGMTLEKLTNTVCDLLPYSETLTQDAIFKLLFTLYYAQVFSCTPGFIPTNPIILGLRDYTDTDFERYDRRFIENSIRQYSRETKNNADSEVWSELYFGDKTKVNVISEILKFV